MRIASWNVNSIRSRLDQLTAWLARAAPDVLCCQETKVEDSLFPSGALEECGYKTVWFGQKTYNGVSISARFGLDITNVKKGLDGDDAEAQKRVIAATVEGVRIVNVYVPNGQAVGSPAFAFKLDFFDRLRAELAAHHAPGDELIVCGDFNVAPEPIDVHDPKRWEGQILFHPDERAALRRLMDWGLVDGLRERHPNEAGLYSWWDYRMGAYRRNAGVRIDHALLTKPLAARCKDVTVDRRPRELQKPSDHAPVIVELA